MIKTAIPAARDRYDRVTIAFHWLTALVVLALFFTPLLWNNAPRSWGLRYLEGVHVSLGIALAEVGLGFGLRWLQGEEFSFFGLLSIPSLLSPDRATAHALENLHNIVGWAIIYVAAAHAAAALYHRYVLKDGVLNRMVPAR